MRLPPLGAAALALAGLGVLLLWRVVSGVPSMGGDNAGYLVLARSLLEGEGYRDLYLPGSPLHTKYPPLYPLLLAGWMAAGASTWLHYMLLSGALVLGAGVAVLLWAAERREVAFGFGLAFLALLSPAFLSAATEILSEPLFLLLTFVALWAAERAELLGASSRARAGWLALAAAAAILGWWTRSAGLALVLAVGGVLLLRRRWAGAGTYAVAFGLPAALWTLRGRGATEAEAGYVSEFWMVNPYRPELGTVGPADLLGRVVENVQRYVGGWIPGGLTGLEGGGAVLLGVLLTALAAAGWVLALRRRVGVTELFLPLYGAMILLWPEVWASERFALPLLPVILLYAGGALADAVDRWTPGGARSGAGGPRVEASGPPVEAGGSRVAAAASRAGPPWWRGPGRWGGVVVAAAAAFLLLAPAAGSWWERAGAASFCRGISERAGPFGCYGPVVQEYVAAALWSGSALPEGAVVLTRKPRIFHVLSGRRTDVFPFSERPSDLLGAAREAGARYAVADRLDAQASRYLVPAVIERPGAFCVVRSFGSGGEGATHLLGILPGAGSEAEPGAGDAGAGDPGAGDPGAADPDAAAPDPADGAGEGATLEPCPAGFVRPRGERPPLADPTDPRIPLLRDGPGGG